MDARKCDTCRKYWKKLKQCRPRAPKPVPLVNTRQAQQGTMWLTVDGEGCDEWEPRENIPHAPNAEDAD
jgi:hypothetical protein